MADNYTVVLESKGVEISRMVNVGYNTIWRSVPWMIEDAAVRGQADLDDVLEESTEDHIRSVFRSFFGLLSNTRLGGLGPSTTWFQSLTDNGETELFGITIRLLGD